MAAVVYLLCAAASLLCTFLLFRAYLRVGTRLLFWSAVCFACLTVNNVLLSVDLVLMPASSLFEARNFATLVGVLALLYGLVWEAR